MKPPTSQTNNNDDDGDDNNNHNTSKATTLHKLDSKINLHVNSDQIENMFHFSFIFFFSSFLYPQFQQHQQFLSNLKKDVD